MTYMEDNLSNKLMRMESKKNNAIVFFANLKYRFALAEMLVNLQKTNPNLYDNIIIYHSDLSEEDINKFLLIEQKCIFIRYSYEEWEQEYKAPATKKSINFVKQYSHLAYVKYRIFELLEYYHKVLFLDLDMLILDNISELFEIKGVAWRSAIGDFGIKFDRHAKMDEYPQFFSNFPRDIQVPNGGLIYVSGDDIDWRQCLSDGHDFLVNFMDYFSGAIDELAISYMVEKNKIPLTILDRDKYNALSAWYSFDTKIIHFASRDKVWNSEFMQTLFPQWMKNYKISKQIALFDSEEIVEYPKTCVRKKLNEETWFEFLSKSGFQIPEELNLEFDFSKNALQMKYKPDIFWEIVLDLYGKTFKSGLWIRNPKLLENLVFLEEIKKIDEFYCEQHEKGLYIYTDKKNTSDTVKLFDKFYNQTFNCIIKYLELSNKIPNGYVRDPFFALNKDTLKLDAKRYFEMLHAVGNRYSIFVSCKDECSRYFKEFVSLSSLSLNSPQKRESYVAVICGGEKVVEKISENRIQYSFRLNINPTLWVTITSEGYRLKKEKSSILINNIDYSMNLRGLNFVVVDNLSGYVVDFFNIDTYGDKNFSINRSDEMIKRVRSLEYDLLTTL